MSKHIIPGLVLSFLMMAPAFADAAEITELNVNADCQGWTANAAFTFTDGEFMADVAWSVSLVDAVGTAVEYANGTQTLRLMDSMSIIKMYEDVWPETLTENLTAYFVFTVQGVETVSTVPVNCGPADEGGGELEPDPEPEPNPCLLPYRWWRRNADQWPVETVTAGDTEVGADDLRDLHRGRNRWDRRMPLVRQLIAAKLNVANGAADDIQADIDAADAFLQAYPLDQRLSRRQQRSLRREIRDLRAPLRDYNRLGCPDGEFLVTDGAPDFDKSAMETSDVSFESLKAMYR